MPRSTRRSFVTLPAKTELTGCFSRRVGRVGAEAVQPPALLMGMLCTWYDFEIISRELRALFCMSSRREVYAGFGRSMDVPRTDEVL